MMLSISRNALIILTILVSSCANLKTSPKYELGDGNYRFRHDGERYKSVTVFVKDDSTQLVDKNQKVVDIIHGRNQFFQKRSLDIDVVTMPFKFRPGIRNLPRQLTTDFNGNLYIGYRIDRFGISEFDTPFGRKKVYRHRGVTFGAFGGIGSTAVTPWTTDNKITDEYSGFVLSRGIALLIAANNLTVGAGIGFDSLTDRDKEVWLYQNKPWYGLTLGLNIN